MKLYHSLSEAIKAIYARMERQVIGIVSFNGQAYFVERSNVSPEKSVYMAATKKLSIGNELAKKFGTVKTTNGDKVMMKLQKFMHDNHVTENFTAQAFHAEENIMRNFNAMVQAFRQEYPDRKIATIDIVLSHSPCVADGSLKAHRHSSAKNIAGLDMPAGCFKKIELFFKRQYKAENAGSFEKDPKIRVKYLELYEDEKNYENSALVKPADSLFKEEVSFSKIKKLTR